MPVCIAGMHRSGTSMVARLLNLCGLYLGEESALHGPGPANPEGFWENWQFVKLNDELLEQLGSGWDIPVDLADGWELAPQIEPLRVRAAELIESFKYSEPWGWKDPRNSITLPFWRRMLPNISIVVCLRSPAEVARSLQARGSSSLRFGYQLWLWYYQRILASTSPEERIVTHYSAFFQNPHLELKRLVDSLQLLPFADDALIQKACSTIAGTLRHHKTDDDETDLPQMPDRVLELYAKLCAEAQWPGLPGMREQYQARYSQHREQSTPAVVLSPGGATRGSVDQGSTHSLQPTDSGSSPRASVIIINHNGEEHLRPCLSSLHSMDIAPAQFEIIVVDNGSDDDSIRIVQAEFPQVRLICAEQNLGFSRAANLGASAAAGTYLVFLNNDMRVDSQWLSGLLRAVELDATTACVGSVVLNWDGTAVDFAGRRDDCFCLSPIPSAALLSIDQIRTSPMYPVLFASGGAMLIRRSVFLDVGGFDDAYFMYHEDVDLGWRLWLLGYRCVICPDSVVYHRGGASSKKLPPAYVQSLSQKHSLYTAFKCLDDNSLGEVFPLLMHLLIDRASRVPSAYASLSAVIEEFVDHLGRLIGERRRLQEARVRSDADLFALVGHPFEYALNERRHVLAKSEIVAQCSHVQFDPGSTESVRQAVTEWFNAARYIHERHLVAVVRSLLDRLDELSSEVSVLQSELATIHSSKWWGLVSAYWAITGFLRGSTRGKRAVREAAPATGNEALNPPAAHPPGPPAKPEPEVAADAKPAIPAARGRGTGLRSFRAALAALKLYLANHLVNRVPSFRLRHWYYRHVLHYSIGRDSSVHMGVFVTGDFVTIGDNVVVNRNCYLDGRIGVEIRDNVSISPGVWIISMEHDPDSPDFRTRGAPVVIEENVWIGARATIAPGVTIGAGAVIGAGAMVVKSVNPYRIAVGVPAKEIRDRTRDLSYRLRYFTWFDTDVQK